MSAEQARGTRERLLSGEVAADLPQAGTLEYADAIMGAWDSSNERVAAAGSRLLSSVRALVRLRMNEIDPPYGEARAWSDMWLAADDLEDALLARCLNPQVPWFKRVTEFDFDE